MGPSRTSTFEGGVLAGTAKNKNVERSRSILRKAQSLGGSEFIPSALFPPMIGNMSVLDSSWI